MFLSKCPRGPVREENERTRLLQDVVRDGVKGQTPPCKHWTDLKSHPEFQHCLRRAPPPLQTQRDTCRNFTQSRLKPAADSDLPCAICHGPPDYSSDSESALGGHVCPVFRSYSCPGDEGSSPDRLRRQDSRDFFSDVRGARDPAGTPGRSSDRSIDRF